MKYMLDTNICIDILRGRLGHAPKMMQEYGFDKFKISTIVAGELWLGVEKSANVSANRRKVGQFLSPFEIVSFDSDCAKRFARIRATLESEGKKIGLYDMLIATHALSLNAVLVTNNVTEFKRVPGLSIESWQMVEF